jgi:hypothetical protein
LLLLLLCWCRLGCCSSLLLLLQLRWLHRNTCLLSGRLLLLLLRLSIRNWPLSCLPRGRLGSCPVAALPRAFAACAASLCLRLLLLLLLLCQQLPQLHSPWDWRGNWRHH